MKIYFSASIRGGRDHADFYSKIVSILAGYGEVLTTHIGDKTLSELGEPGLKDVYIYERDMAWLRDSDVLVADVTIPSTGVGYEIAYAEMLKKKVLCLYHESAINKISGMINGNENLNLKIYRDAGDLEEILKEFFK